MRALCRRFSLRSRPAILALAVTFGSTTGCGESSTPTEAHGTITTSNGVLVISSVTSPSAFPPGCSAGPGCSTPETGFRLIVVWLARQDGGDASQLASYLIQTYPSVSIASGAGTPTTASAGGLLSGLLFVLFEPPAGEASWTMSWPGNAAVQLPDPQ